MSCCGSTRALEETDEVSRLVTEKLAAFLRTLRDNGFAVGLAEGWDMERTIRFASAAAALKCLKFGGRLGAPNRAETLAMLVGQLAG